MSNFYITGYRSYELGIIGHKDVKITYIRKYLLKEMELLINNGVDWFVFGGQTGIEFYAFQCVNELKEIYPNIKTAVLLPFANFGDNFQGESARNLTEYKEKADFITSISKQPYFSPRQLQAHTQFILRKTQGTWMLYDSFEQKGKTEYFYQDAYKYQENNHNYQMLVQTFDDLNQSFEEF